MKSSSLRASILLAALPIGLLACGSSSPPPAAKTAPPAVGGGPTSLPTGMEAAGPLLGSMTASIPGLSNAQAATGAGSLLSLAQQKLPADQFAKISGAVPGADALLQGAAKAGVPTSGLTSLADLNSVFSKAGISPTQVTQLTSLLGNSISNSAGPSVAQSFFSAVR
jgi:hypothetical protein